MRIVISPEKAIADGISPDSLIAVAEWHEERARIIKQALTGKKKRAFGAPVTQLDQVRHEQMAGELYAVAATAIHLTKMRAAA